MRLEYANLLCQSNKQIIFSMIEYFNRFGYKFCHLLIGNDKCDSRTIYSIGQFYTVYNLPLISIRLFSLSTVNNDRKSDPIECGVSSNIPPLLMSTALLLMP